MFFVFLLLALNFATSPFLCRIPVLRSIKLRLVLVVGLNRCLLVRPRQILALPVSHSARQIDFNLVTWCAVRLKLLLVRVNFAILDVIVAHVLLASQSVFIIYR
jgi:hypothetical protein